MCMHNVVVAGVDDVVTLEGGDGRWVDSLCAERA